MMKIARVVLLSAIFGFSMTACSENSMEASKPVVSAADIIAAGMSDKDAIAKLGAPALTETRTLDAMTITFMEWPQDNGKVSAQFINGVAQHSQFSSDK
jgi:hypothetical protein